MALFLPNETFAYIAADEKIKRVDGTDVIDRGPWLGSIAYVPNDVVQFNDMLFVALTANFNTSPSSIVDDNWSSLVRTAGVASDLTVDEVYALAIQAGSIAYDALRTAWAGTAAASWAYPALTTAWTGTAAAYEALQQAWYGTQAAAEIGYPALVTSWVGTATANSALAAASAGTLLADTAYRIAVDGTNLAYEALQKAWYGTEAAATIGYPALVTSWVGTATANSALAAASHGTATATTAYNIAVAGTNLAYEALQKAWYGTEAAATIGYPALVTSWVGTATANTALIAAGAGTVAATQAINMAATGTAAAAAGINLANQALLLAQVGTVAPFLDELQDVQAPMPTANQVLAWDGSQWIASDPPSTAAASAFTYYLQDVSSGTSNYERLLPFPAGGTEEYDTITNLTVADGARRIAGYISESINRTLIDAGLWEFKTYAVAYPQPGTVATDIYLRHIDGSETYLFSGTANAVFQPTPQLVTKVIAGTSYPTAFTDKLVAKYWGFTEQTTPITLAIIHNGTEHYSNISTPLRTDHNDLAGLQGGQSFEYYHLTADESAALAGTDGDPSAANKFVTNTDSRLATGVQGYYIATAGTSQAEDAYDLAQRAYDLASANPSQPDVGNWLLSGGNVVWVSGYSFDVQPTTVSFNGTAVSFAGTSITLQPSDPIDDRIDLVITDRSYGTIGVLTGVASTPPAVPDYDPSSQFELTFIPVDNSTTEPVDSVTRSWIYRENAEWTFTGSPTFNPNSATSPYQGTKSIEATNPTNNQYFYLQAPLAFALSNYDTVYFYIKPKSPVWGTRYLRLHWETSGAARRGNYVTLGNGSFGFDVSNLNYQLISIPLSLFGVGTAQVQRLRVTAISSSGAIGGFWLDDIAIQIGLLPSNQTIPDASTTVKGIVQLEQDGGMVPGRAVTGDDYRLALAVAGTSLAYDALQQAWYGTQAAADIGYPALVTAWVGTATANVALSVASTGTAGLAAEITNRTNADLAEASTRGATDTHLQNQINEFGEVLGITFQGTFSLYMANFRNGPPDNKVTVINGVVTGQTPSYYIWEDFENYPSGTLPPLTLGSSWDGAGTIVTQPGLGIQAEEPFSSYGTGTITYQFTGSAGPIVLNAGTGWSGTGIISVPYVGLKGTETFDSYAQGTYGESFFLNGGWGWLADGTIVAR